jgi:hypothetical protein
MIRLGSTITLEAWDPRFKGNMDFNHAWGAAAGNIIARYLLGVRPLEPGFERVLVRPMPGLLESASSVIPTIRGPITVSIENKKGEPFRLDIGTPVNVMTRVEIPLPGGKGGITIDGQAADTEIENGVAVLDSVGSGMHVIQTTEAVKSEI